MFECLSSDAELKKRGLPGILEARKRGFYAFFMRFCNRNRDRARLLRGFGTKSRLACHFCLAPFLYRENGLEKNPFIPVYSGYSGLFRNGIFRYIPDRNISPPLLCDYPALQWPSTSRHRRRCVVQAVQSHVMGGMGPGVMVDKVEWGRGA